MTEQEEKAKERLRELTTEELSEFIDGLKSSFPLSVLQFRMLNLAEIVMEERV